MPSESFKLPLFWSPFMADFFRGAGISRAHRGRPGATSGTATLPAVRSRSTTSRVCTVVEGSLCCAVVSLSLSLSLSRPASAAGEGRTAEISRGQLAQPGGRPGNTSNLSKTAGKDPKITSKRDACSASPPRCAPASPPRAAPAKPARPAPLASE